MLHRKPHLKESIYFIHPQHGVTSGRIRSLTDTHATIVYKIDNQKGIITKPLEELSFYAENLQSILKWSPEWRNIPEKYAKDFVTIGKGACDFDTPILLFLYKNLQPDAKHTARVILENYYHYDIEDPDIVEETGINI